MNSACSVFYYRLTFVSYTVCNLQLVQLPRQILCTSAWLNTEPHNVGIDLEYVGELYRIRLS